MTGNPQRESRALLLEATLVGCALGTPFTGLKEGHIQQLLGGRADGFLASGIIHPERPGRNHLPGLHGASGQRLLASMAAGAQDELDRKPPARAGAVMLEIAGGQDGEGHGAWRQPGRPLRRALHHWRDVYPWDPEDYFTDTEVSEGLTPVLAGLVPVILGADASLTMAHDLARLTHWHPHPVMGAVAVAILAGLVLEREGAGRKLDGPALARLLVEELGPIEAAYHADHQRAWREAGWTPPAKRLTTALSALPSLLREANDDLAVRTILATAREFAPQHGASHVQHGYTPVGLCWGIYRALGPLPPVQAVEDIMNRGGECETLCGLVTGIMAMRYGREGLPGNWYDGCMGLAEAGRLAREGSWEAVEAWLAREATWSGKEEAMRAPLRDAEEARKRAEADKERKRRKQRPTPEAMGLPPQEEAHFAPPPQLWLEPGDEEHPEIKRKLKAARGKKKIGWKEERRKRERGKGDGGAEE